MIHSELTERKFIEVQKVLSADGAMVITAEHVALYHHLSLFIFLVHVLKFYRMLIIVNQITSPNKLVSV